MIVEVGGVRFGNDLPIALVAGPCVIEDGTETLEIAREVARVAAARGVGAVFKASYEKANRQSGESFRGPGLAEGLRILARVKAETGLPILTDVHRPADAESAAAVADLLQIPAFLCRQSDLVEAAAATGRTLNVKKGQFMDPAAMRSIVEKAAAARPAGSQAGVLLTERGTTFGYGDLVVDMRGLETMKALAPVLFDATHSVQRPGRGAEGGASGGDRAFVPALARAAAAVGIAGIFVEVHPDPARARSDAATQWPLDRLGSLLDEILAVDRALP